MPHAIAHRDTTKYERQLHAMNMVQGSKLAGLYPNVAQATVNSIHHQAVKDLGRDLVVEARSAGPEKRETRIRNHPRLAAALCEQIDSVGQAARRLGINRAAHAWGRTG